MTVISEILTLAVQHYQAGRLPEAESLFKQVLQVHPDHSDALHGLGVITYQLHQYDQAVLSEDVAAVVPESAVAWRRSLKP